MKAKDRLKKWLREILWILLSLALAVPAFGQYYYLPGGNFVVRAEPWRRSTDGPIYPADDHPTGTILYGPDLYWNGRDFVEGSQLPVAEYYEPRPYHPRHEAPPRRGRP